MSEEPLLAVRCAGPEVLRRRWYRTLAYALAATSHPSGVLFESALPDPVPWVTVRPASLIETVRASPSARVLPLERRPRPPALEPPEAGVGAMRHLIHDAPRGGKTPWNLVGRPEPADLRHLVGDRGWLAFQTVWIRTPMGGIVTARRVRIALPTAGELARREASVSTAVATAWAEATGFAMTTAPAGLGASRDWRRGSMRTVPDDGWTVRSVEALERTAEVSSGQPADTAAPTEGHRVVFGASGSGKTTYLARIAARHIEEGGALVALDLHGDLTPAIVGRLAPRARAGLIAVDASAPPVPGIAALSGEPGAVDRSAAHLVAALKRLSPDGNDVYWGFRLERIFDSFARLVLESSGSIGDLYALLTDRDRRESARLATRRVDLARFLEELEPVLRRQPDFLWSAATRLSKVALVPALAELLGPADGGLPVEDLLEDGRSVLVRLPFARIGPESASFAGTLLLSRIYLGLAARRTDLGSTRQVMVVLDEVHAFSPRLVAELLTESRKFGLRALVATQFPDRLAPELTNAVAGSLTDVVAFGVPRRAARTIGEWVGLPPGPAERELSELPPGHGVRLDPASDALRGIYPETFETSPHPTAWWEACARSRREFPPAAGSADLPSEVDPATERLLLAVLAAEEEGSPLRSEREAITAAEGLATGPAEPEHLGLRWLRATREGWVAAGPVGYRLTVAGMRQLGLGAPTDATRESTAHRELLVRTFRIFARRGHRIEILRQGRYDTTLPDAIYRQLSSRGSRSPRELAEELERVRPSWAWRFFGGRDVHVEAEVSGALRAERIRRGWEKAKSREAFALFVVGDARRARRVRATLRSLAVGIDRAQVWTLRETDATRAPVPAPRPKS